MKSTFTMVLILCGSMIAFGQQNTDAEPFSFNDHWIGGFSLNYRGQEYGTAFGIDPQIAAALRSDRTASPWVDGYETKLIVGNVMLYGGLASMVVTMFTAKGTDQYGDPQPVPLSFTLGLASSIGSLFVFNSSSDDLRNAVHAYNFNLENPPPAAGSTTPTTSTVPTASDESAPSDIYIEEGWFSSFKLYYHQVAYDTGFGVDERLASVISADPDLRSRLGTADATRTAGWGLLGAGLLAMPVGLFTGLYGMLADGMDSRQANLGFGIASAGIVTAAVISPLVLFIAGSQVRSVVKDYNGRLP